MWYLELLFQESDTSLTLAAWGCAAVFFVKMIEIRSPLSFSVTSTYNYNI